MNNTLELYHNILLVQQPWLDNTTTEQKFQQMLHELPKENLAQQPLYELVFPKPLTSKRKYYHLLFANEANRYINNLHTLMNQAGDDEKKFWIHDTLTKKLKDKLNQTETVICNNNFQLAIVADKSSDKKQADDAYTIQYLKYQLIRLYLEIQNSFSVFVKEDLLTEEDIHSLYFSETPPQTSFIVEAAPLNLPKPATSIAVKDQEPQFNAIKADIRGEQKNILTYTEIIAKPDRFALVEEELFNTGLIDSQYGFIKKHGNVEKMAAVYHIIIQKKHFNPFSFRGGKKKITDLHIRKFLNSRYAANIDKEFRNFKKKESLQTYLDNNATLALLIPS